MANELILAVDDEAHILELLSFNLEASGYRVVTAATGEDALVVCAHERPAMVLLDIMLPGIDGMEVCRRLKSAPTTADIPIIMLTAKGDDMDKILGLEYGADDYITKPFNILEVKARIKAIMRRVEPKRVADDVAKFVESGDMRLDCEGKRAYIAGKEIGLTAKEFEVLELLMLNPNKVYSRENLLKLVWGADYPGDVRTVDVHVRRLREKVEANPSDPQYVYTKWGVGYFFKG